MILFIDTETTGKLNFKLPTSHESQPRIVQLAAAIADDQGNQLGSISLLIRPEGWTIPSEASAVHGFTTEQCRWAGVRIDTALDLLRGMCDVSNTVVAHNLDFDYAMIERESVLMGRVNPLYPLAKQFCTMRASTDILKLPGNYGKYKWPSLAEAHRHFTGKEIENAHDALADVVACMKVYFAMNPTQRLNDPAQAIGIFSSRCFQPFRFN